MATLEMQAGTRKGRSGSLHYVDADVQAVNERIGIPYEVLSPYTLAVALSHSKYGIQVVEFNNGAICYGFVNFQEHVPAHQTLRAVERMQGVQKATFIRKENAVI